MEGAVYDAPIVKYLTEIHTQGRFTLVDVGCAGGIDHVFHQFGRRLRALGVDPNVQEIKRLQAAEKLPGVKYLAAYVDIPATHPFRIAKGDRSEWGRNAWDRFSTAKSIELLRKKQLTSVQQTEANLWTDVELAVSTIILPQYLATNGYESVDFLKIDVDGKDFDILNSFDDSFDSLSILGAALEVNFFGSEAPTDHTFHNTDRFMKAHGFELFSITSRHYSMATLPARYVYGLPAQTITGRIVQGDAIYFRDICAPANAEFATTLSAEKLLNLVCAFAVCNLPDCAAEVLVKFRETLSEICPVDRLLDLLAEQSQGDVPNKVSYEELMQRFEAEDPMFFPPAQ
jgi:FkbM family methyltransferase